MQLKGNYYCSDCEYDQKGLMLVLNFSDITLETAQEIIDKTIDFADDNLHCKDCYYVSFDSNGKMRKPKSMRFQFKASMISYSVMGLILPDKNLRQSFMDKPSYFNGYIHNEKDFYDFMKNNLKNKINIDNSVDFEIVFMKDGWDELFNFEVKIKVSRYSLDYKYDEIIDLYKTIIYYFSESYNLFAGYIDFCHMEEGSLVYEYCYYHMLDRIETENLFKSFRSFSWGGYLNNKYLMDNPDLMNKIKCNINYEVLSNGLLYFAECKIEQYDWLEQRKQYKLFKDFLTRSFGVICIDHLIELDYKPFDNVVYLFKENSYYCAVYSNGFTLFEINRLLDGDYKCFTKGKLLDITKFINS